METYSVRVTKDYLVFCSAHFISFDRDHCEPLHGHNYRLLAEITGNLDESHLVIDFIVLKDILRGITNELDHHVLLAEKSPILKVNKIGEEIRVSFKDKKQWIFPSEDCVLLPIENTTAELIATWIANRLQDELKKRNYGTFSKIAIEVEEAVGQLAIYELHPNS